MDWSLLGFKGLGEVINIHPVFVHFPIALFPATLLFYFVGIIWKKEKFIFAGRISLTLAVLSAGITVLTGELAEESFPHNDTVHNMMMTHEKIGITVLVCGSILWFWSFWLDKISRKGKIFFLSLLLFTTLLVLQNGDLGGRMVFVEGASVKSQPAPIHLHEHHHFHK